MRKIFNIIKYIGYSICTLLILSIIIWFSVWLLIPVYSFPESKKFSGEKWYNPYEGLDNKTYYKANLHAHSKLPLNILNGRNNTPEDVYKAYYDMAYEFATLSNYQTISKYSFFNFPVIQAQEYGINILKTHLLLTGSNKRHFFDQPFIQDIHTKQWRINHTKQNNELVSIAHPRFNYGFLVSDFEKLSGYDMIEVLSVFGGISSAQWDTALSNGRPAMIIGNDDTHDVFKNQDIGRNLTMLPIDRESISKLYEYLRAGKHYGLRTAWEIKHESRTFKKEYIEKQPTPQKIEVKDDILNIKLSDEVETINFISDNGKLISSIKNTDNASIEIPKESSYVRIEAITKDSAQLFFNPIMRSNDGLKPKMEKVFENKPLTFIKQTIFITILLLALIYFGKRYRKKILAKK